MAAFQNDSHYVLELAYRTQLNMLQLQNIEYSKRLEENPNDQETTANILLNRRKIREIQNEMAIREYTVLEYCNGTQLINSFLGLLVLPSAAYYQILKDNYRNISDYRTHLPTLSHYTDNPDREIFYHECYTRSGRKCNVNIFFVLSHLRNAISHDRISIFPMSNHANEEVTDVVFTDKDIYNGNPEAVIFYLKIRTQVLPRIISEMFNFFKFVADNHPIE